MNEITLDGCVLHLTSLGIPKNKVVDPLPTTGKQPAPAENVEGGTDDAQAPLPHDADEEVAQSAVTRTSPGGKPNGQNEPPEVSESSSPINISNIPY